MSGGYFDYTQYAMNDIADSIQEVVDRNDDKTLDKWGYTLGRGYTPETIAEFKRGIDLLRRAFVYAHRIDWLLSDDDGEETFHERLKEDLDELQPSELDLVDDMSEVVYLVKRLFDLGNVDDDVLEWVSLQGILSTKVDRIIERMGNNE